MILKACLKCIGSSDFINRYDVLNIASCPVDGACNCCKNDKPSKELRWIAVAPANKYLAVSPHHKRAFPLVPIREYVNESVNLTPAKTALADGNHVSDTLKHYFGESMVPCSN